MKRKFVFLILAVVMAVTLFGCGTTKATTDSNTTNAADTKTEAVTEAPADNPTPEADTADSDAAVEQELSADGLGGYKIGFWYLPPSDLLSASFRKTLDQCAKLTNCEMVYYDMTAWSTEDMNAAVESLVSSGCNGVINPIGSSPSMYEYLNDNKVYYVGLTRSYSDELGKIVDNSEYCTGWIGDLGGEDGVNFKSGYALAKVLADSGCKKIGIVAASEGETMNDERVAGVKKAAEDNGMEIIATYRGGDAYTGFSDILSAYGSELDGIYSMGGDAGVATIQAAGLTGKIKLVQFDPASEDTKDYMEAGLITATYAGGSTYIVDLYMQLFNALSGADRLFNEGSKIVPQYTGFIVKSAEEWDQAQYCMDGGLPGGLLPNEILSFNSIVDPGKTIKEREDMIRGYQSSDYWNITSIYARVSSYLK